MAKHRYTRLDLRLFSNLIADLNAAASALSYYHKHIALAIMIGLGNAGTDFIDIKLFLRHQDVLPHHRKCRKSLRASRTDAP